MVVVQGAFLHAPPQSALHRVTRARRTAIVLGDHWGIQNCAKRCQVDDRRTFLPLFLDAAQHAEADFARVAEAE